MEARVKAVVASIIAPVTAASDLDSFLKVAQGPVFVFGDAGTGKSTAVRESLERENFLFVSVPGTHRKYTQATVVLRLLEATGVETPDTLNREYRLLSRLRMYYALNGISTIVIDEADNLSGDCIQYCNELCRSLSDIGYRIIYIGEEKPAGITDMAFYHYMPLSYSDVLLVINTVAEKIGLAPETAMELTRNVLSNLNLKQDSTIAIYRLNYAIYDCLSQL
ncbi:MAG: ATP-binding protein [Butyrivibrio sp.]|nr:ATP-binding protein [Butyrivibrio sp.]